MLRGGMSSAEIILTKYCVACLKEYITNLFPLLYFLRFFILVAHTMVLFFQMVTLNVAVNSYSNALLTLLISNQFVEIKGSVFKKFEKENLFQLSCSGKSLSYYGACKRCSLIVQV